MRINTKEEKKQWFVGLRPGSTFKVKGGNGTLWMKCMSLPVYGGVAVCVKTGILWTQVPNNLVIEYVDASVTVEEK